MFLHSSHTEHTGASARHTFVVASYNERSHPMIAMRQPSFRHVVRMFGKARTQQAAVRLAGITQHTNAYARKA
jgi:hypothetical protein